MGVALSFIVPIYKKPPVVLERCLRSILDQSLTDYEIICVFDGPDSEAHKTVRGVLKNAKVPCKLTVIDHGGACKARNAGIALAKGRYIVSWDADCYIEPHAAKAWVEILDKNPEYAFCYSGYKFADEKGGISSQEFDPFTLRVANYISSCFPLRRELNPGWDEDLESAQDWSYWLSVVTNGGNGKFLQGYAFTTEFPDSDSISGKGCAPDVWLARQDKVREKHGIPKREVCVTSVANKHDGLALAKLIEADYHDRPSDKPNHYKTVVQVGFSLNPGVSELHASAWGPEHKKILFWTKEDVEEIYNAVSLKALEEYASRLNQVCDRQFVEDIASRKIMEKAGFSVAVLPMPLVNNDPIASLPETPTFLIDAAQQYGHVLGVLKRALPEFKIEIASGAQKIEDTTGLISFYMDRCLGSSIKRMKVSGRHVVSNVQSPFAGFLEDKTSDEQFIVAMVKRLRKLAKQGPDLKATEYYKLALSPEKFKEVLA